MIPFKWHKTTTNYFDFIPEIHLSRSLCPLLPLFCCSLFVSCSAVGFCLGNSFAFSLTSLTHTHTVSWIHLHITQELLLLLLLSWWSTQADLFVCFVSSASCAPAGTVSHRSAAQFTLPASLSLALPLCHSPPLPRLNALRIGIPSRLNNHETPRELRELCKQCWLPWEHDLLISSLPRPPPPLPNKQTVNVTNKRMKKYNATKRNLSEN